MAHQEEIIQESVPVAEAVQHALHNVPRPNAEESREVMISVAITGFLTALEAAAAERLHVVGSETEAKVADVLDAYTQASNTHDGVRVTAVSYAQPQPEKPLFQGLIEGSLATTHSLDYVQLLESGIGDQPGISRDMLAEAERCWERAAKYPGLRDTLEYVEALGAADILASETSQMAASLTEKERALREQAERFTGRFTHNDLVESPAFERVKHLVGGAVDTFGTVREVKKRVGGIVHGLNASTDSVHDYLGATSNEVLSEVLGTRDYPHGHVEQIQGTLRGIAGALGPEFVPTDLTPAQYIEFSHALVTRGILRDPDHVYGATGSINLRTVAECMRMAAIFDWKQQRGLSLTGEAARRREEAEAAQKAAAVESVPEVAASEEPQQPVHE